MHAFQAQPPPLREDKDGVIRVANTRVSLESVVIAFDRGASAEEIVDSFPPVDLATVYAVLAYVLSERRSVNEYLGKRKQIVDQLRVEAEKRFPAADFRARLLARRRNASS